MVHKKSHISLIHIKTTYDNDEMIPHEKKHFKKQNIIL